MYLEKIINIYVKANNDRVSSGERTSELGTYLLNNNESNAKQVLVECLNNLRPSFKRFKKTKSFRCLYRKVKEFEEISQKIYM